jgi:hypothetical protein
MNENELRRVLDQSSTDVQPSRDRLTAARRTAARRRRRRDAIAAGVGGAAFSVVAVLGMVNLQSDGVAPGGAPADETLNLAAQVEATAAVPVPLEQSASRPAVLVGAAASGRLVNIDSTTGKTTSLIGAFQGADGKGQLLGGLALAKDQRSVYFDVNDNDSCQPKIMQASLTGGTATFVVNGSAPAVSNDGRSLAYVQHLDCDKEQVVERVLATGEEHVIGRTDASRIAAIAWSPDDSNVAIDLRYDNASKNRLVEVSSSGEGLVLDEADAIRPSNAPDGTVFEWPSYLPDGRLFVSERCCVAGDGKPSSRLIVVNPEKTSEQTVIAIGLVSKSHTANASDASGSHLLYLSGQDLMVSDDGKRPSPISYGLLGATWR